MKLNKFVLSAAAVLSCLIAMPAAAAVVVVDNYLGGLNTYNGADVIGTSLFDIQSAAFQRIGAGGNTLQVTINTNYAGAPGTGPADGTGYGALFLTPGANTWHPTGVAPYPTDVYQPGEWAYAFTIPQDPSGTTGLGGLYAIGDGEVVLSNVYGNTITYPHPGSPGYYFREGQAVQFTPDSGANAVAGGAWSVQPGQLIFNIDDNHLLGDSFSFSWAMTCGNDVIQGQVAGVPEPATWSLMIGGLALAGASLRRRRAAIAA